MSYFGSGYTSVEDIRVTIYKLEDCFKIMKEHTLQGLEQLGKSASVRVVVLKLTDLRVVEKREHKVFLESNVSIMSSAADHYGLFSILNLYWDYLAYHLLDHLIREFSITEVKVEMEQYKIHLQKFRTATPLGLFCQAQKNGYLEPKDEFKKGEFKKVVAKFNWPEDKTLEVVEDFRQDYAGYYCLHECAMMLIELKIGSFLITWVVPESIVKSLKTKVPEKLFISYSVTKLTIAGDLVYQLKEHQNVSEDYCNVDILRVSLADTKRLATPNVHVANDYYSPVATPEPHTVLLRFFTMQISDISSLPSKSLPTDE